MSSITEIMTEMASYLRSHDHKSSISYMIHTVHSKHVITGQFLPFVSKFLSDVIRNVIYAIND